MLMHPWISDRLAAEHRSELVRVAPRHREQSVTAARGAPSHGAVSRRLGHALIAVGRRLAGPEAPGFGPALSGGRAGP